MSLQSSTISSLKEIKDPGEIREKIDFTVSNKPVDRVSSDCIWVGVFSTNNGVELSSSAMVLDKVSKGKITKVFKSGDFNAKLGANYLLRDIPGILSTRILLVGCGQKSKFSGKNYSESIKNATKTMLPLKGVRKIASFLTDLNPEKKDGVWKLEHHVTSIRDGLYSFNRFKTQGTNSTKPNNKNKKDERKVSVSSVEMILPSDMRPKDAANVILHAQSLSDGIELARDLGNLPPNICTSSYFCNVAKNLSKHPKIKCEIINKSALEKLGMNSFLAVSQGSVQPPYLIVMSYSGGKNKDHPSVLVGKGITFDSGGISIKPSASMDEMKYDMCGAAAVFGVMKAISEARLKKNVVGVVAACENMPSGTATRPGDIVTSMSGKTIEILNTDAEGRLILCDALTYVERFKPKEVIDIATLTGACVVALGSINTGLFSPSDDLAAELVVAGENSLDATWRMPLEEDYSDLLKSPFADIANVGGREAGSISAACFLWKFAESYPWAHLDIAGTAWKSGSEKNATGRPVPMLFEFLKESSD